MTRPVSQQAIQMLTAGMTPAELQEVQDLLTYMGEKASPHNPSGFMPEGGIPQLLNRASPRVQQAFATLKGASETPRNRPFEEKWSERDYFEAAGLDGDTSQLVADALDGAEVTARTIERLGGSDATREPDPVSMRDQIAASVDFHEGGQNG